MDLGRFFVPEEAPPTPITPTRPIPTRLQPVSGSIQAYQNHPGSLNWLQSMGFATGFFGERTNSNVVATHLNSEESIHQGRRIGIVGTYSNNGSTNATAGMSNIAYMEFLAQNNVASARAMERVNNGARSPFIPISYSQIHGNQQQSNSEAYNTWAMQRATSSAAYNPPHPFHHSQIEHTKQQVDHSQELVNRNVSESSNTWTNNCQAPTTSDNGISVPYNTVYNLNSSHKTMLDAFSNGAISFSSVPVTPDNGKRVQNQISEIANGHAISFSSVPVTPDNGKRVQNQISEIANGHTDADEQSKQEKGKQLAVSPTVNEDTEFRNDEPLSQLMECSPDAFLSPTKATNQNSGKRRHTIDLNVTPPQPKPIRKKHRPKVVREGKEKRTPRPATPKQPSTTEKPSGKRKYVRKNGLNASNTPSVVDVARETTVRSCKRALNFNLEDQAADRNPGTALNHQERPKSQAQDMCTQGLEVVVEKSPRVLPFDLNCSLSQVQSDFLQRGDNDYSSMPPQQIDSEGIREIPFRTEDVPQSAHQPSQKSRNDSNCSDNAILAGSKRAYCGKTEEKQSGSTNLTDGHFNSLEAYQEMLQRNGYLGMHFPTIYKKKRTDKGQGSGMPDGMRRAMACRENGTNNGRSTPLSPNVNNGERNSQYDQYFHPITTRHTAEIPLRTESMSRATLDKQKCPEFMLSFGPGEMKTKKRSKVPTRVRDFASLTAIAEWNQLPATTGQGIEIFHGPQDCMEALAVDSPAKMPKKKRTKKRRVNSVSKARGPSEVSWPYMTPLDDIVRKLNLLSITGERRNTIAAQEQTAIVPFGQVGTMVPYEGQFDPTKRRRPRPKVDLDSETERVWKLLMEKDTEDAEETSEDKEKWWEGERRVFRGRAESFIARMHLVQGDRRFSQWKGSVVDSVIGVFLTQNVSDHLSSSAFMSLAARFPLQSTSNNRTQDEVGTHVSTEKPEVVILDSDDTEWHVKMPSEQVCDQGSITLYEAEHIEVGSSKESFQSNSEGDSSATNLKEKELVVCNSGLEICCKSSEKRTETTTNGIRKADFVVDEDRRALEDIVSSQNSEESSVFQTTERIGSCADSNSEADLTIGCKSNNFEGTSFMELLHMASKTLLSGNIESESAESEKGKSSLTKKDCVKETFQSIYPSNPNPIIPFSNYHLHMNPYPEVPEVECVEVSGEESRFSLLSPASEVAEIKDANCTCNEIGPMAEISSETKIERKLSLSAEAKPTNDQYMSRSSHSGQPLISSGQEATIKTHPHSHNNLPRENAPVPEPKILNGTLDQRNGGIQQSHSKLPVFSRETSDVVESTSLEGKQKHMENKVVEPNSKEQVYSSERVSKVTTTNTSKGKGKPKKQKKATIDWDSLRRAHHKCTKRERSSDRMDSLDWEAVRCADVNEIADTIKERGMNHMLAERIKDFLNRLVREHGSIDLEWLRDVPPDKVKEYLLSVRGLGLKSVECVRLLTLHHLAFPVDTNVGRIAVRLGWVPLQPLPESLQLHLLELYPVQETIQKYLWPRLCTLDQRTLYELHYQMITFGKVFCSKSKPNCNACPMRAECKHFASAFASARLALPGPEEKGMVTTTAPVAADQNSTVGISPLALPLPEENQLWETRTRDNQREPIIEEPATPEPDCKEVSESDIEDAFWEDPDEIPTIKLNMENFTLNLQNYMQENIMGLQEGDMSKALVALTPEAASIPIPKLKNVSRLRTEHQVYELPDSHPLLKELDRREPDDPCSYLLAIWTPGETAESIQPPKGCSASQESGKLCDETTCFSCNSTREANSQMVRGTLLIPCKTAMRGSFPLNGTYFQVNEVFADHDSSLCPINVPRAWIWNLPRRTVFFGTSIPSIFKGLSTEAIQNCFWRGFVCVRGFDHKTRSPRPLRARLHFPASKMARTKTSTGNE